MFVFQFLFLAISIVRSDFEHDIVSKIQMLHSKTELGTFYELLNVSENASLREIKKQFRKLNREKNPFPEKLNDMEYTNLLMTAFSVLTNHRSKYDAVLANSNIYLPVITQFQKHKLVLVMATISVIIMGDF
ncbi:dnaJ-class molecular chaperone [Enterocytozoon bieneusi H348]|nr:dnaJ-class molecular chaperone [Enterocytozoon bieneusi H348]|eukprot:XP_002651175.1 dnaJ-class molecular chaperone [Enterocytozoon bieneusi H348]